MTWDLEAGADVDAAAVGACVEEAVRLHPEYKADETAILAKARDRARKGGSA